MTKNDKQFYKKISIISALLAVVFLFIYAYASSHMGSGPWWYTDPYANYAIISLPAIFVTTVVSILYFFKYKQNTENIIYRNISAQIAAGAIMILLILIWRLIVLTLTRDTAVILQLSLIEWAIVVIGIVLIALGIPKKAK